MDIVFGILSAIIGFLSGCFICVPLLLMFLCSFRINHLLRNLGLIDFSSASKHDLITVFFMTAILIAEFVFVFSTFGNTIENGFCIGFGISIIMFILTGGYKIDNNNFSDYIRSHLKFISDQQLVALWNWAQNKESSYHVRHHINAVIPGSKIEFDIAHLIVTYSNLEEAVNEICDNHYSHQLRKEELSDKEQKLNLINQNIMELQKTFENAKRDLGDNTIEDLLKMRESGIITDEKLDEFINAIESLQFIIDTYPEMIKQMENDRNELLMEINNQ